MPGLRRRMRFHGLKRPKVRQDMNKYNLYNLSRLDKPLTAIRTYFQQKWTAKATTRAYHGEQMREKQWQRLFSRTSAAVVPMNPDYLARHDGSEQAAGRGSGLEVPPEEARRTSNRMPYMQMVYHPTERRLDTAIFRALFASSARQARQFVTHGQVKVNGKKMLFPGYMLNPGDMFQVEPERVMYAIGAFKDSAPSTDDDAASSPALSIANDGGILDQDSTDDLDPQEEDDTALDSGLDASSAAPSVKSALKAMRTRAKTLLAAEPKTLSGKQKQELRAFTRAVRAAMSRPAAATPSAIDDLEVQLQRITSRVPGAATTTTTAAAAAAATTGDGDDAAAAPSPELAAAIERISLNPHDPSKPYATPWRPRDWMSAFAFVPRYLEVQHAICAAVYLRHPVVKPGLAEVPTPFHPETGQLTFNWYLRRGR